MFSSSMPLFMVGVGLFDKIFDKPTKFMIL
jgi:hypothetical protein